MNTFWTERMQQRNIPFFLSSNMSLSVKFSRKLYDLLILFYFYYAFCSGAAFKLYDVNGLEMSVLQNLCCLKLYSLWKALRIRLLAGWEFSSNICMFDRKPLILFHLILYFFNSSLDLLLQLRSCHRLLLKNGSQLNCSLVFIKFWYKCLLWILIAQRLVLVECMRIIYGIFQRFLLASELIRAQPTAFFLNLNLFLPSLYQRHLSRSDWPGTLMKRTAIQFELKENPYLEKWTIRG